MTLIVAGNAGLNNRFYSVTGTFSLTLITPCFYRQPGYKIMRYLLKPYAYTGFIVRVNRDFINPQRIVTALIPIGPSPKLTSSQQPAVSSFEAYPTPAR